MAFLETLAVIAAILSAIFFIGAIIWALKSSKDSKIDESVRHIEPSDPPSSKTSWDNSYLYQHRENTNIYPPDPPQQGHYEPQWEDYPIDQSYSEATEVNIPPGKMPGIAAASDIDKVPASEFYKIEGYEFEEGPEGVDVAWDEAMDVKALPQVVSADGKTPKVEKRERPHKRVLAESARCNICLGYIKTGLPLITCICGKNYHISCGSRIEECPMCHHDLLDYEDKTLEISKDVADAEKNKEDLDGNEGEQPEEGIPGEEDEKTLMGEGDLDVSTDILDKDQMERLTKLLKRYNLDEELSKRSSMGVLRGK